MPLLSVWHTFSGTGSYIMSPQPTRKKYLLCGPDSQTNNLLTNTSPVVHYLTLPTNQPVNRRVK